MYLKIRWPHLAAKSLCTMFLLSRYFIPAATCDAMSSTFEYEIDATFDVPPTPTRDAPLEVDVVVDVDDDDVVTGQDDDVAGVIVTRDNCRR